MRFDADLQDAFDVESLWRTNRDNKLPQIPWQAHVRLAPARWLAHRSFATKWRMARALSALHLRGDPIFHELMATNLTLCFPSWTVEQRVALARECATEAFFAQIDQFRVWELSEHDLRDQVTLLNADLLHRLARSQPVVVICPHFVGIEAAAQRLSLESSFVALYRAGHRPAFEAHRKRSRERFNAQYLLNAARPLTPLIRRLKNGTPLFLLPDVDSDSESAVYSPFFGVDAATARTTAWCAAHLGAAVLPMSIRRSVAGQFVATLHEPLSGLTDDIVAGTHRVNEAIEALVRATPSHYAWAQPRFATRPFGEPALYSHRVLQFARDRIA